MQNYLNGLTQFSIVFGTVVSMENYAAQMDGPTRMFIHDGIGHSVFYITRIHMNSRFVKGNIHSRFAVVWAKC